MSGQRADVVQVVGGYEAVASAHGETPLAAGRSSSRLRRSLVACAVGIGMAVCCVAMMGRGQGEAGEDPLALGLHKLLFGGKITTEQALKQGLRIGATADKKVKYFTLDEDPSLGSQEETWGYTDPHGPSAWASIRGFGVCASGPLQSPINIERAQEKARLNMPPLRWEGYVAQDPKDFIQQGRETRVFFDGHSICLSGPSLSKGMNGPNVTVHGFSRYLPSLPLDAVALVTYTLKEIRFHTPAEHQIDGIIRPFEMQMVHECTPPVCPTNKTMIVSALFKEARPGLGEKSPDFITSMMQDLSLIEGVWSQYVESFAFDFGTVDFLLPPVFTDLERTCSYIAKVLNKYSNRYFLLKGSLTTPPCTEDVTWYILKDELEISTGDLRYAERIMGRNARPLQPLNDRAIFDIN